MGIDDARIIHVDRSAAIKHAIKNQAEGAVTQLVIGVSASGTPSVETTAKAESRFSVQVTATPSINTQAIAQLKVSLSATGTPSVVAVAKAQLAFSGSAVGAPSIDTVAKAAANASVRSSGTPSINVQATASPSASVTATATPNIVSVNTSRDLLQETKDFETRVNNDGGVIEPGALAGLYDPLIQELKNQGYYSSTIFLGAASAVKHTSDAIGTLYDASGNKTDTTQTDSAKKPTRNTNATGGHWGASGDGSDDGLVANLGSVRSTPQTRISFGSIVGSGAALVSGFGPPGGATLIFEDSGSWAIFSGSFPTGGTHDTSVHGFVAEFGTGGLLRVDGTQVISSTSGTRNVDKISQLASPNDSRNSAGVFLIDILIDSSLTTSEQDSIRQIPRTYYGL